MEKDQSLDENEKNTVKTGFILLETYHQEYLERKKQKESEQCQEIEKHTIKNKKTGG